MSPEEQDLRAGDPAQVSRASSWAWIIAYVVYGAYLSRSGLAPFYSSQLSHLPATVRLIFQHSQVRFTSPFIAKTNARHFNFLGPEYELISPLVGFMH